MGLYFNMTEDEREFAKSKTVFCLIIYDVISNKRRVKLAQLLESYGVRVQKSCFEVIASPSIYRKMLEDIAGFYDETEQDNIIVYKGNKEDAVTFNLYRGATLEDDCIFL